MTFVRNDIIYLPVCCKLRHNVHLEKAIDDFPRPSTWFCSESFHKIVLEDAHRKMRRFPLRSSTLENVLVTKKDFYFSFYGTNLEHGSYAFQHSSANKFSISQK